MMQSIPNSSVISWRANGARVMPVAVRMRCGYCKDSSIFKLENSGATKNFETWSAAAECASCSKLIRFFAIIPESKDVQAPETVIYVSPPPDYERQPVGGIELVPQDLRMAYFDALETFNSRAPSSAVLNQCRQALEAIVYTYSGRGKGVNLYNAIKALPSIIDLDKPFVDIADAIRGAGNIGSHYKSGRSIPSEIRSEMINMVEYLLEYLYIIPFQVHENRQRIARMDSGDS